MTLKKQYKSLSERFVQDHRDLIDSFLDKRFDPFQIDTSFAINSKPVPDNMLAEEGRSFLIKEIFVFPLKKGHSAFCIALARSDNSSYEILLNDSIDKTEEFYSNLIELINSLITNKDIIKKHIDHDQKIIKAYTALECILSKLSQNSVIDKPPFKRPDPPGVKIRKQEGSCAMAPKVQTLDC